MQYDNHSSGMECCRKKAQIKAANTFTSYILYSIEFQTKKEIELICLFILSLKWVFSQIHNETVEYKYIGGLV